MGASYTQCPNRAFKDVCVSPYSYRRVSRRPENRYTARPDAASGCTRCSVFCSEAVLDAYSSGQGFFSVARSAARCLEQYSGHLNLQTRTPVEPTLRITSSIRLAAKGTFERVDTRSDVETLGRCVGDVQRTGLHEDRGVNEVKCRAVMSHYPRPARVLFQHRLQSYAITVPNTTGPRLANRFIYGNSILCRLSIGAKR